MKHLNILVILAAASVALSSLNLVQAAEVDAAATTSAPTWEFTGGTTAQYAHSTSEGTGTHVFNISVGADYFVSNPFELGLALLYVNSSASDFSNVQWELLAGPTFNFCGPAENAFFLTAKAGVFHSSNNFSASYSQFTYQIGLGRRVEIVKHVTWKPEVSFVGMASATDSDDLSVTSSTQFVVTPLQFSVLF